MGDAFTSSLVSPVREPLSVDASHVAQEWVSEHMLQKHGAKDAEARMNRQVAERLAVELRAKCDLITTLQEVNDDLQAQVDTHATLSSKAAALDEDCTALRTSLAEELALRQQYETDLEASRTYVQELREQNFTLHGQLSERHTSLARQRDGYNRLLEVSRKVASQNQVLNTEAERLGGMVPSLQRESDGLKEALRAVHDLREENTELRRSATLSCTLAEEVESLRSDAALVPHLQHERALLIQACEKITNEVPSLNSKIEELTRECERVPLLEGQAARLDHEATKSRALECEVERLHGALCDASKQVQALSEDLHRAQSEGEALQRRLPHVEEELRRARLMADEVPGLHALRDHLSKSADEMAAQYDVDVGERDAHIADLMNSLQKAEESLREQLLTVTQPLGTECERLRKRLLEYEMAVAAQKQVHAEEVGKAQALSDLQKAELMKKLAEKDALIRTLEADRQAEVAGLQRQLEEQRVSLLRGAEAAESLQGVAGENLQLRSDMEVARDAFQKAKSTVEGQAHEIKALKEKLHLTLRGVESVTLERSEKERALQDEVGRLQGVVSHLREREARGVAAAAAAAAAAASAERSSSTGGGAALRGASPFPESPRIAPPRPPSSSTLHASEVDVLRRHMSSTSPDIQLAAVEADALGHHPTGYWTDNGCRRTKVWMSQPLQC